MSIDKVYELLVNNHKNVFITGPGGTGKSHIIRGLEDKIPNIVKLCPTGISANNIDGRTYHSYTRCGMLNDSQIDTMPKMIAKLKSIVDIPVVRDEYETNSVKWWLIQLMRDTYGIENVFNMNGPVDERYLSMSNNDLLKGLDISDDFIRTLFKQLMGRSDRYLLEVACSEYNRCKLLTTPADPLVNYIIFDEVSMISCYAFDFVNLFFQWKYRSSVPFGGCKVLLAGDLLQLPPVSKGSKKCIFITESNTYKKMFPKGSEYVINLTKNYRQDDPEFTRILNSARMGQVSISDMRKLNGTVVTNYENVDDIIELYGTNEMAGEYNKLALDKLNSGSITMNAVYSYERKLFPDDEGYDPDEELYVEVKIHRGNKRIFKECESSIDVSFDRELYIKEGCRVMITKNLYMGTAEIVIHNGMIGTILTIGNSLLVEFDDDQIHMIDRNIFQHEVEDHRLTVRQFPIRLGYAITIHKSQGIEFDRAVINIGRTTMKTLDGRTINKNNVFSDGQAYVALSRVKSLVGMVMRSRATSANITANREMVNFYKEL